MYLHKKYLDEASSNASALRCPECGSGSLEFAAPDDNVYVCSSCSFSCDDSDLEDAWVEAMAREYGYDYISEDEGDDPDDYIEVDL